MLRNAVCRVALVALIALASQPSPAGVKLVLQDGRELTGRSVERKGSLYLLQQEGDNLLTFPVELVDKVIEDPPAPTGLEPAQARTLVGPPGRVELPGVDEQTGVLRSSRSVFRQGVIDPTWVPTSDWDNDLRRNNFNPTRWYVAPIDPNWTPRSGLGKDVTDFNPARWYVAPIDATWWPEDGLFRRD